MTITRCRAKDPAGCTNPRCPDRFAHLSDNRAARTESGLSSLAATESAKSATVTNMVAWLITKDREAVEEILHTNDVEDWVADLNAAAAVEQRTRLTDMFNLQQDTLHTRYKHAFLSGDVGDKRERLDGFKHGCKIVDEAITDAGLDGLALDKILRRVRRQRTVDVTAEWSSGLESVILSFKRVYGDEIYRAKYNQRKNSQQA